MTTLQFIVGLIVIVTLIPDSQEFNGALLTRGRRQSWGPPVNLGPLGKVCSKRSDTRVCTQAAVLLQQYYHVQWNKIRCRRNHHEGHRMQCHIKVKQSKTTDFECYVKNAGPGGNAVAKCRSPWKKDMGDIQRQTGYGGAIGMGAPPPGMQQGQGQMGMNRQGYPPMGGMGGMGGPQMGGYGGYGGGYGMGGPQMGMGGTQMGMGGPQMGMAYYPQ
ncbi:hypothetical protein WDU94_014121 [Cyamophila willieti]